MKITFDITKDKNIEFYTNGVKFNMSIIGNEATIEVNSVDSETEEHKDIEVRDIRKILGDEILPMLVNDPESKVEINDELINKFTNIVVRSKIIMNFVNSLREEEIKKLRENYYDRISKRGTVKCEEL